MNIDTKTLAGTAVLGALVVVFDYTMKYSALKIPFPWLPFLKFDFTGIPIVLSFLLFGLMSGVTTSAVASLAIFGRSGDVVGSSMKGVAEFSTILGMALGLMWLRNPSKLRKPASFVLGITLRCLIMFFWNLIVQPLYYGTPFMGVLILSPLIAGFNAIQGSISVLGGYFIYEAIARRIPSLVARKGAT